MDYGIGGRMPVFYNFGITGGIKGGTSKINR
jgi:hypothetical protein